MFTDVLIYAGFHRYYGCRPTRIFHFKRTII